MPASNNLSLVSETKTFDGILKSYTHQSGSCNCEMRFSIFLPPQVNLANKETKCPVLYWLSGLTCTDENFMTKSGAQSTNQTFLKDDYV